MTARRAGIAVLVGGESWLGLGALYGLGLLLLAATDPAGDPAAPDGEPLRLAVLVPAHEEAAVVGTTVGALLGQGYPAARREVIVIADNCTDATAPLAAAAGATVWERDAPDAPGKGQALAWALARLRRERPETDAVVLVDADCTAAPGLLGAVDATLRRGARAVQVAYRVANPDASPGTALRWAGFALLHEVRPRGRRRLGLSAGLFGTGMAFDAALLREVPWESFSVVEDAEYHLRLVEAGIPVAFVAGARVESAMPTGAATARGQQLRWEGGKLALARRTVPGLVASGVAQRDPARLHAALEQLLPPQTLQLAGTAAVGLGGLALRSRPLALSAAALGAVQAGMVVGGLRLVGAPPAVWRALRHAPGLLASRLGTLARVAGGQGAARWVRTAREFSPAAPPTSPPPGRRPPAAARGRTAA